MADVEFRQVEKVYADGTRAVSDLSLAVEDGELLVFVGPSGCGKSTLLRLLAGLEDATAGALLIGARVVNGLPPQRRNVAMVFQDYALYPYLTVRGNLEFPLRMRRLPRAEIDRRVAGVAEMLGLSDQLARLPRQLSGGQRQRVAMGRALVREADVVLLDEPLSNLDARLRVQMREEIVRLRERTGSTMIYVTHDQVEAMTLGDRVAVLHRGRLQQVAAAADLYQRPANLFVAGFVGSPPMNLFPTRLHRSDQGSVCMRVGDQAVTITPARAGGALIERHLDRPLTGGVRPEDFRVVENGLEPGTIAGTVAHAEYLGHETLIHLRPDAAETADTTVTLVARLAGMHRLARGAHVRLCVDPSRVHVFDSEGIAIRHPSP